MGGSPIGEVASPIIGPLPSPLMPHRIYAMSGLYAAAVSKQFRIGRSTVDALADIDLVTPAGSFTALLGPSGCGKSTLLRLFAGLDVPSAGALSLHGRSPEAMRREHRIGV